MRVAITGGSGFLGRALIRRLCKGGADRIVTASRDEQKRAALTEEFGSHPGVRVYAADVRDERRLVDLFSGCEVVIHAAARKVVTGHSDEPDEMRKTNIDGTLNVIEAARAAGCRKLVLISSDKACRPENVYGVSKAMAEYLTISANARTFASGMRLGVVRYGNVLGSTGSVAVKWRQQASEGKPLSISDPRMTRFWITRAQAVDLVLRAVANLRGGEIVVPNLPAAPLLSLASAIVGNGTPTIAPINDAPLEVGPSAYAPRQGGEKLHEELMSPAEMRRAIRVDSGYFVIPPYQNAESWDAAPWVGEPFDVNTPYASNVWPYKVSSDELAQMLAESFD